MLSETKLKSGALAPYFSAVAYKRLSAVETDITRSNQHEFNGSAALRQIFGPTQPRTIPTHFLWLPRSGGSISARGFLTWYDARESHPTRSEYRLYFPATEVTRKASPDDVLVVATRNDGSALLVISPGNDTAYPQLFWLFGIEAKPGDAFAALELNANRDPHLQLIVGGILEHPQSGTALTEWVGVEQAAPPSYNKKIRDKTRPLQTLIGDHEGAFDETGWDDVPLDLPETTREVFEADDLSRTFREITRIRGGI